VYNAWQTISHGAEDSNDSNLRLEAGRYPTRGGNTASNSSGSTGTWLQMLGRQIEHSLSTGSDCRAVLHSWRCMVGTCGLPCSASLDTDFTPQTGPHVRPRGLRHPSAAVRRRRQRPHAGCPAPDASPAQTTSHGGTVRCMHCCFPCVCLVMDLVFCKALCTRACSYALATRSVFTLRLPAQVFAPSSEGTPEQPGSLSRLPLPSERVSADSASGQVLTTILMPALWTAGSSDLRNHRRMQSKSSDYKLRSELCSSDRYDRHC